MKFIIFLLLVGAVFTSKKTAPHWKCPLRVCQGNKENKHLCDWEFVQLRSWVADGVEYCLGLDALGCRGVEYCLGLDALGCWHMWLDDACFGYLHGWMVLALASFLGAYMVACTMAASHTRPDPFNVHILTRTFWATKTSHSQCWDNPNLIRIL